MSCTAAEETRECIPTLLSISGKPSGSSSDPPLLVGCEFTGPSAFHLRSGFFFGVAVDIAWSVGSHDRSVRHPFVFGSGCLFIDSSQIPCVVQVDLHVTESNKRRLRVNDR